MLQVALDDPTVGQIFLEDAWGDVAIFADLFVGINTAEEFCFEQATSRGGYASYWRPFQKPERLLPGAFDLLRLK